MTSYDFDALNRKTQVIEAYGTALQRIATTVCDAGNNVGPTVDALTAMRGCWPAAKVVGGGVAGPVENGPDGALLEADAGRAEGAGPSVRNVFRQGKPKGAQFGRSFLPRPSFLPQPVIATGHDDSAVRVWDAAGQQLARELAATPRR